MQKKRLLTDNNNDKGTAYHPPHDELDTHTTMRQAYAEQDDTELDDVEEDSTNELDGITTQKQHAHNECQHAKSHSLSHAKTQYRRAHKKGITQRALCKPNDGNEHEDEDEANDVATPPTNMHANRTQH